MRLLLVGTVGCAGAVASAEGGRLRLSHGERASEETALAPPLETIVTVPQGVYKVCIRHEGATEDDSSYEQLTVFVSAVTDMPALPPPPLAGLHARERAQGPRSPFSAPPSPPPRQPIPSMPPRLPSPPATPPPLPPPLPPPTLLISLSNQAQGAWATSRLSLSGAASTAASWAGTAVAALAMIGLFTRSAAYRVQLLSDGSSPNAL